MKTLKSLVIDLTNRGMSQQKIAKIAGVSQMTISRWKNKSPELTNMHAFNKMHSALMKKQGDLK